MFIGHVAVGFALKRVAPRTSLGMLVAAPLALDLLWPCFLLLGWERVRIDPGNTAFTPLAFDSYPLSHSLVMSCAWAGALGACYLLRPRSTDQDEHGGRRSAAIWLGLAVVSHWVLDWMTHRPDMPLSPWSPMKVGLGLWNSVPATLAVETAMFAAGVWVYASVTQARDRMGRINFWAFVGVLLVIYAGNVAGPPPPDTHALALVALGLWVFPIWAGWMETHRAIRPDV